MPSTISPALLGSRPVTGVGTNDAPPGISSTIASNSARPARNGTPAENVADAATCRSCLTGAIIGPAPVPESLVMAASQVTPYRTGEASR